MRVRLVRKLAEWLDGVDVSASRVGDVIDVTQRDADVLIAEGWGEAVTERPRLIHSRGQSRPRRHFTGTPFPKAEVADEPKRPPRSVERLREIRQEMEKKSLGEQERRRAEDLIREELHDARAKTVRRAKTVPKKSA